MAPARGPDRGDRVVAALRAAPGIVLSCLSARALARGDLIPGLAFAAMAAMPGTGRLAPQRVTAADATAALRQAPRDRRDRARMERIDHGGVDGTVGPGAPGTAAAGMSGATGTPRGT